MNKKNFIKLAFVFIACLLSFFIYLSTRYEYSQINGLTVPISLLLVTPVYMHYKYSSIRKIKFKIPYLIIMYILYAISIIFIGYLILVSFYPYLIDENGARIANDIFSVLDSLNLVFSNLLFMCSTWLVLILCFNDLDKKCNNTEFILTVIVSLIIILIHTNFCINPNLSGTIDTQRVGENASYITQNYIFFGIMYSIIIINKMVTKKILNISKKL